jgi:adenylosuccinate synthase
MGDVVNLKRFKKRNEREQSAKQAETNRVGFGRTKSERVLDERRAERANDLLDQHRIDGEDAS